MNGTASLGRASGRAYAAGAAPFDGVRVGGGAKVEHVVLNDVMMQSLNMKTQEIERITAKLADSEARYMEIQRKLQACVSHLENLAFESESRLRGHNFLRVQEELQYIKGGREASGDSYQDYRVRELEHENDMLREKLGLPRGVPGRGSKAFGGPEIEALQHQNDYLYEENERLIGDKDGLVTMLETSSSHYESLMRSLNGALQTLPPEEQDRMRSVLLQDLDRCRSTGRKLDGIVRNVSDSGVPAERVRSSSQFSQQRLDMIEAELTGRMSGLPSGGMFDERSSSRSSGPTVLPPRLSFGGVGPSPGQPAIRTGIVPGGPVRPSSKMSGPLQDRLSAIQEQQRRFDDPTGNRGEIRFGSNQKLMAEQSLFGSASQKPFDSPDRASSSGASTEQAPAGPSSSGPEWDSTQGAARGSPTCASSEAPWIRPNAVPASGPARLHGRCPQLRARCSDWHRHSAAPYVVSSFIRPPRLVPATCAACALRKSAPCWTAPAASSSFAAAAARSPGHAGFTSPSAGVQCRGAPQHGTQSDFRILSSIGAYYLRWHTPERLASPHGSSWAPPRAADRRILPPWRNQCPASSRWSPAASQCAVVWSAAPAAPKQLWGTSAPSRWLWRSAAPATSQWIHWAPTPAAEWLWRTAPSASRWLCTAPAPAPVIRQWSAAAATSSGRIQLLAFKFGGDLFSNGRETPSTSNLQLAAFILQLVARLLTNALQMSGDGVVQAGERLSNWAASLLPAAEVTPSTMRKIFKPSTAPLLAFLEEHVLSSVRSRDIRENILLQTKRHELAIADSEHEEACAEHEEILEEVLATRQNIDSLQVEVEHLKAELQAAEEKLLMAKEPVEQRQTRSVITGAFVLRTGEAVIRTRGFAQRLETAVEALEMKPSRITETHPEYPGQDKQTDDVQNVVANAIEATRNLLFQDSLATLQCKPSKASPRDQALTEAVSTEAKNEFENAIASSLVNGGARPSDILSQALSMCARAQDEVGRPEIAQDFTNTTDASPRHALTSSLLKWQDLHIADERTGALSKHKTEELTHPVLTDLLRFLEGSAQTWITHHSAFFEWELLAALEKELHEMHDALQIPEPMRPTSTSTPGKLFSALSGKGMTDEFARQFVANNESLSALVIRHEQMALYGIKSRCLPSRDGGFRNVQASSTANQLWES
eukprot:tig00000388_g24800.t1